VDVGAVQTEVSQGQPPNFLGGPEDAPQEGLPCWKKGLATVGKGVVSRLEAARKAVARPRLLGRSCHLAGAEGAGGVARKPQPQKPCRREGLATAWTSVGVESPQVPWREHGGDAACPRVRRQTVAQRHGGIEGCFIIGGCELSAHAPSGRCVSACGQRVLSDRLLASSPKCSLSYSGVATKAD
jgi:hypothetical protein